MLDVTLGSLYKNILFCIVSASQEKIVTMKDFSAFLDTRRCKNWDHETDS